MLALVPLPSTPLCLSPCIHPRMSAPLHPCNLVTNVLLLQLFTHVTRFLGFKVVLLGQFNGQGLLAAHEEVIKGCVTTSEGLAPSPHVTDVTAGAALGTCWHSETRGFLVFMYVLRAHTCATATPTTLPVFSGFPV